MNETTLSAFADEFLKIAAAPLTPEQKFEREKALKIGLMGAVTGPVVSGLTGLVAGPRAGIANPKWYHGITGGTRLSRWLPATMVAGGLVSGALPLLRSKMEHNVKAKYNFPK